MALALVVAGCGTTRDSSPPPSEDASASATEDADEPAPGSEPETASEAPPVPANSGEVIITANPEEALNVPTFGWATDFTRHTVPLSDFRGGGPGKDGIPAIDDPSFVSTDVADDWLEAREPVVEVVIGHQARAYPLQILIWHEIVNDEFGGVPVTVTFCPLCNTALAFDRRLDDLLLDFGTTGNLRNSDLVMYDRQTESWWQQFGGAGVVGELAGKKLTLVPAAIVPWERFVEEHPEGEVLSRDTGHNRPYGANPYTGYDSIDTPPFFPAENLDDDRLPPKERVVFIERKGEAVAVPFATLADKGAVEVRVGGETLQVTWEEGTRSALDSATIQEGRDVGSADVRLPNGERVPFDTPFWFAVAAFRPDVVIVEGDAAGAAVQSNSAEVESESADAETNSSSPKKRSAGGRFVTGY